MLEGEASPSTYCDCDILSHHVFFVHAVYYMYYMYYMYMLSRHTRVDEHNVVVRPSCSCPQQTSGRHQNRTRAPRALKEPSSLIGALILRPVTCKTVRLCYTIYR